jgi:adenylate cyclase class 2
MPIEVEQKFAVVDPTDALQRLDALGVVWHAVERQLDVYFAHPARDFAQTDEAVRLRVVGEANWLTYKGPKLDPLTKTRHEIDVPLARGDGTALLAREALIALGFRPVADVVKSRRHGQVTWDGALPLVVGWDEVDGLGTFIELERVVESHEVDVARAAILAVGARLGLGMPERRSYLELLLAGGG